MFRKHSQEAKSQEAKFQEARLLQQARDGFKLPLESSQASLQGITCVMETSTPTLVNASAYFQAENSLCGSAPQITFGGTFRNYIDEVINTIDSLSSDPHQKDHSLQLLFQTDFANFITDDENPQLDPPSNKSLKKLRSIISTWTLRSLRAPVINETSEPCICLCKKLGQNFYQPKRGPFSVLQRSLILICVGYNFALATCLPHYLVLVLRFCCEVLALTKDYSNLLRLTLPSSILKFVASTSVSLPTKKKERTVEEITIKILESLCEKVASYGANINKVMETFPAQTLFEEVPFVITKDISYLLDSIAACRPILQSLSSKHFTICENILAMMIEKNLINITVDKLVQCNDSILHLTSYFDESMNKYFSYSLLLDSTAFKAATKLQDAYQSLKGCKLDAKITFYTNLQAMWSLFYRVLYYSQALYVTPSSKRTEYLKGHLNLTKDFFQISTGLLTEFSKYCYDTMISDQSYIFCLSNISQALKYCSTYSLTFEEWTDLEHNFKQYWLKWLNIRSDPKIVLENQVNSHVTEIYQDLAIGILTTHLVVPCNWATRRPPIILGGTRFIRISDACSYSIETADTISIDAMTDDSDASTYSSRTYNDDADIEKLFFQFVPDVNDADHKYDMCFGTKIYLDEKYSALQVLSNVPSKRLPILSAIRVLYEVAQKHCANVNPNTIHSFVQAMIAQDTEDLYALSLSELKQKLLWDIIVPCQQLQYVNTLNDYYNYVEEIETDCSLTENDILEAILEKDQLRLVSKLNSVSDTVQYLLDLFNQDAYWLKKFCYFLNHPQHTNSILYQLESCGFEKFRIVVYRMLDIYINILNINDLRAAAPIFKDRFIQFLNSITSSYYQATALKAIFMKMTELNFAQTMPTVTTIEAFNFCTDLAMILRDKSSLEHSILKNSLNEFGEYLKDGNSWTGLSFSGSFFLTCPLWFACPRFTTTLSHKLDLIRDYLYVSIEHFNDSFVPTLIRAKILRLVYEHVVSNANGISSPLTSHLPHFVNILTLPQNINMKQYWETRMASIDDRLTETAFRYFRTKAIGNLLELSDAMNFIFVREMFYRLYHSVEMVSCSHLRKSIFTLNYPDIDEIMNTQCVTFNNKQNLENLLVDDLSAEFVTTLSNGESQFFCMSECLWKINAIGEMIRNNHATIDDTRYETLFSMTLKALANNMTLPPEFLVMMCKFLICYHPDKNTFTRIIFTGWPDLQRIEQQLKTYKDMSSSLYRFCVDLLHSMYLYSNLNDNQIVNNFDINNYNIESAFIPRYMTLASKTLRKFLESTQIKFGQPKDVDIGLIINSKLMLTLLRNANFSLCHFSESNSNILVIPAIKRCMKIETKLELLQKEINNLQLRDQECIPIVNRSMVIMKPLNASAKDRPRFEYLANESILTSVLNYMNRQHSSLLSLSLSKSYRYFFPILDEQLSEGRNIHGNLLILQDSCREINRALSTCMDEHSRQNIYFVAGYLIGVCILSKYILGPVNLDKRVLQLFLNETSLTGYSVHVEESTSKQLQVLYECFNSGIRMVLHDEIVNTLKILTSEEFLALLGDEATIERHISLIIGNIERDTTVSLIDSSNFVFKLVKPTLNEDKCLSATLVNYFNGMFMHDTTHAVVTVTVIPAEYTHIQIKPHKRIIEIPLRSTKDELILLLRQQPHISFE
ncbi:hypothetical protein C9374_004604 [Naegleria lovaniensis]|uniref:HECT domain-containing protein n=1 Tax=Naegleria lovaniensis TaxID=51637 RepID=A0AA88KJI5_NAELO|nr:uncharacterized protein C9374_004604 [Naegleria lovaniensis]KAG2383267.1 hypothetical protein C9374_004604 [Naegleria lovaniensis]